MAAVLLAGVGVGVVPVVILVIRSQLPVFRHNKTWWWWWMSSWWWQWWCKTEELLWAGLDRPGRLGSSSWYKQPPTSASSAPPPNPHPPLLALPPPQSPSLSSPISSSCWKFPSSLFQWFYFSFLDVASVIAFPLVLLSFPLGVLLVLQQMYIIPPVATHAASSAFPLCCYSLKPFTYLTLLR